MVNLVPYHRLANHRLANLSIGSRVLIRDLNGQDRDELIAFFQQVYKGQHAALHCGEIQHILVSRPLQGLGLGSLLLDKLSFLAKEEDLHWLKAEVAVELKPVIKAFLSKGFQTRTIFDDYYVDAQGVTHDVALMMRLMKDKEDF